MIRPSHLAVSIAALIAITASSFGAAFTPGDIVVYRVGTGSGALASSATAVFLDEYSPTGTLVQSLPMPTTAAGGAIVASGTATSEGFLTLSDDGKFLLVPGYRTDVGTASITTSGSTAINRVVGVVDATGSLNGSTAITDITTGTTSAGNPRSAASPNGTDIYLSGSVGGVRYTTLGSTTSTQLSSTVTNARALNVTGGQLFTSSSSGAIRIGAVGTGLPTTTGQTITNLPGLPSTTGSPYAFAFADLSQGVAGVDTLYVADDSTTGGGILKYSLVDGSWAPSGTAGASGDAYRGLTLSVIGGNVTIFATRKGNELVSLIDTTGYNNTAAVFTALVPTSLASAATNTAFRGVAIVPVPEPSSIALLVGGVALLGGWRRARRVS